MICWEVNGYQTAIATSKIANHLEINVMISVIVYIFVQSLELLSNAILTLMTGGRGI